MSCVLLLALHWTFRPYLAGRRESSWTSWLFRSRFRRPPAPASRGVSPEDGASRPPTADLVAEFDDEDEEKTRQR